MVFFWFSCEYEWNISFIWYSYKGQKSLSLDSLGEKWRHFRKWHLRKQIESCVLRTCMLVVFNSCLIFYNYNVTWCRRLCAQRAIIFCINITLSCRTFLPVAVTTRLWEEVLRSKLKVAVIAEHHWRKCVTRHDELS